MIETLRHTEAFEFFYSLGDKRNYIKVSKQFKVSHTSVYKWSKNFKWAERVVTRDLNISKRIEREVIQNIMEEKKNFLEILKGQIRKVVRDNGDGKEITIKIENQSDLLKTIETAMKLMGDGDGFSDGRPVDITIISAIPRPLLQEKVITISGETKK